MNNINGRRTKNSPTRFARCPAVLTSSKFDNGEICGCESKPEYYPYCGKHKDKFFMNVSNDEKNNLLKSIDSKLTNISTLDSKLDIINNKLQNQVVNVTNTYNVNNQTTTNTTTVNVSNTTNINNFTVTHTLNINNRDSVKNYSFIDRGQRYLDMQVRRRQLLIEKLRNKQMIKYIQ